MIRRWGWRSAEPRREWPRWPTAAQGSVHQLVLLHAAQAVEGGGHHRHLQVITAGSRVFDLNAGIGQSLGDGSSRLVGMDQRLGESRSGMSVECERRDHWAAGAAVAMVRRSHKARLQQALVGLLALGLVGDSALHHPHQQGTAVGWPCGAAGPPGAARCGLQVSGLTACWSICRGMQASRPRKARRGRGRRSPDGCRPPGPGRNQLWLHSACGRSNGVALGHLGLHRGEVRTRSR